MTPQAANWPKPDFSEVSLEGDKPHIPAGELHWQLLHGAVDEARTRVLRTMGAMAGIEADKSLSATGKLEKKQETALVAVEALKKSAALAKARDAVADQIKRWDQQLGLDPKKPESIADAMIAAEIRSHLASLKPGERLAFIDAHVDEVGAAVLTGPGFLSGLTPAEVDIVKQRVAARTNPEIARAKSETLKALADVEQGWRNAARSIRECGGLKRDDNGGATA